MQVDVKISLIDLDGTIADYDNSLISIMRTLQSSSEDPYLGRLGLEQEPDHIEARRKLIQSQPGFWRNLPRHPLGFEIVEDLREIGFTLHVLTKGPSSSINAWPEKVEWCQEHLPDAQITISQDKSLVYGKVLVDDYPPYFLPWLEHRPRGLVIAVAQRWNSFIDHPNVIRYDGSNREYVKEALRHAFNR